MAWFNRPRKYNWPSDTLIHQMKSLEFLVVSAGHVRNFERELEWRISLSLQEKLLMRNLTEAQYKCYMFLKLIKRDIIPHWIKEESVTSYNLKTCLFYSIENSQSQFLVPGNLLNCLKEGLNLLLQWTEQGHF